MIKNFRTSGIVLTACFAFALLVQVAPAASAQDAFQCTFFTTANLEWQTYGDLVYQNYYWPGDAVVHATNWVNDARGSAADIVTCVLTGTIP